MPPPHTTTHNPIRLQSLLVFEVRNWTVQVTLQHWLISIAPIGRLGQPTSTYKPPQVINSGGDSLYFFPSSLRLILTGGFILLFPKVPHRQNTNETIDETHFTIHFMFTISYALVTSLYTIHAPKEAQGAWPRHRPLQAIKSAGRTVQIMQVPIILQKYPQTLDKSTHSPASSLR